MDIILEQLIFWTGIAICLLQIDLRERKKERNTENRQRRAAKTRKSITFPNDAA